MDTFLIKAVQLIVALGLLVIIHEFGHFFFSRLFGVKVEKFYIFFNPVTSLLRWRPKKYIGSFNKVKALNESGREEVAGIERMNAAEAEYEAARNQLKKADKSGEGVEEARTRLSAAEKKMDEELAERTKRYGAEYEEGKKMSRWKRFWHNTEYGIGWLPLGGYCKIAGMIDESMDTAQMKQPAQPWEFRSKPAWQRLLIMIAGVLFNFLLAMVIYAGIVYATGEKYVPIKDAEHGMVFSGEARKAGFHNGDLPLRADGEELEDPASARVKMLQAKNVTVLRDGKEVNIPISEDLIFRLEEEAKSDTAQVNFMTYSIPTRVTQVTPGEGAAKAGIQSGDEIVSVAGRPTGDLLEFLDALKNHENKTIPIGVVRKNGARLDSLTLNVPLSESSKMGIGLEIDPAAFYKSKTITYNIFQSIPRGIEMGTDKLVTYAKSMKLVFTKEGAKSIGGFGAIGSIFPDKWDWIAFWNITAFLSVALAFMNILPIPALDGGHVFFLLYEVITGRKPSDKFMEWSTMIGLSLLILLLVYANGMDIVRLFK
ncbi:MAG: RIP metalloprotease RseP [Muribaculaceae bacterium]|nr:RIP metalloprotease RseP [Muribaculaceae bacterium]